MCCALLQCAVLRSDVLCFSVVCCAPLQCNLLHCVVLCSAALCCVPLQCAVLRCSVLCFSVVCCTPLQCVVLRCIVLCLPAMFVLLLPSVSLATVSNASLRLLLLDNRCLKQINCSTYTKLHNNLLNLKSQLEELQLKSKKLVNINSFII